MMSNVLRMSEEQFTSHHLPIHFIISFSCLHDSSVQFHVFAITMFNLSFESYPTLFPQKYSANDFIPPIL